jgi:hypothetical protein
MKKIVNGVPEKPNKKSEGLLTAAWSAEIHREVSVYESGCLSDQSGVA